MSTIETIMEHLRRTEREQKVRDEGLRRAFHDYADTIDRTTPHGPRSGLQARYGPATCSATSTTSSRMSRSPTPAR